MKYAKGAVPRPHNRHRLTGQVFLLFPEWQCIAAISGFSALLRSEFRKSLMVLIDGCFLHCQGRVLETLARKERLAEFDARSYYKEYTEQFDIDSVPEAERKAAARSFLTSFRLST